MATTKGDDGMLDSTQKKTFKGICDFLLNHDIVKVNVCYDGYGDSGAIEEISAVDNIDEAGKDFTKLFALRAPKTSTESVAEIRQSIEELCYEILPSGWEINDGAFGDIEIFPLERHICLTCNERYTDFTTSQDEFYEDLNGKLSISKAQEVQNICTP
jgi:hypothetical protein